MAFTVPISQADSRGNSAHGLCFELNEASVISRSDPDAEAAGHPERHADGTGSLRAAMAYNVLRRSGKLRKQHRQTRSIGRHHRVAIAGRTAVSYQFHRPTYRNQGGGDKVYAEEQKPDERYKVAHPQR